MITTCKICGKEIELALEPTDGQHVRCPHCNNKFSYRKPNVESSCTKFNCLLCGAEIETDIVITEGQHVVCPYCDGKFSYCVTSGKRMEDTAFKTESFDLQDGQRHKEKSRIDMKANLSDMAEMIERDEHPNAWKISAIGLLVIVVVALIWRSIGPVSPSSSPASTDDDVSEPSDHLEPLYACVTNASCVIIVKYNGSESGVIVPGEIDGRRVIGIGDRAFSGKSGIERIVLPDDIKEIGDYVFRGCMGLQEIKLPAQLQKIGQYAFYGCLRLRGVAIPKFVSEIGYKSFDGCGALNRVDVSDVKAWCEIKFKSKTANPLCASGCELYVDGRKVSRLVIPDGATVINAYAFAGLSSLESVTIPASMTEIGGHAFEECRSLCQIVFMGNAPYAIGLRAFVSVSNDCVVEVPRNSKRWGVAIPGTWFGMRIQYSTDRSLVVHADGDFPSDEFAGTETKSAVTTSSAVSNAKPQMPKTPPSAVSNAKPQKTKSPRKCWKCHGKGYEVKNVAETCDRCGGCKITEEPKEVEKTTWVKDWYGHLRPETRKVTVVNRQPCQQCRRTGRVYVKKEVECSACKGTGHQ